MLHFSVDGVWGPDGFTTDATTGDGVNLAGLNRSYDVFNGGAGFDVLQLTDGSDALLLYDPGSPFHSSGTPLRLIGIEQINAGGGDDVINLTSPLGTYGNITIDGGAGNDVIWAGAIENWVYGDAKVMHDDGVGGNDLLIGGEHTSHIFGDARELHGDSHGGSDRLVSGSGNEEMWGDGQLLDNATGGNDVFVFTPGNGQDTIMDFRQGEDLIELKDLWVLVDSVINTFKGSANAWAHLPDHVQGKFLEAGPPVLQKIGFGDLAITEDGGSSVINFDDGSVTVAGVVGLAAPDFLFV